MLWRFAAFCVVFPFAYKILRLVIVVCLSYGFLFGGVLVVLIGALVVWGWVWARWLCVACVCCVLLCIGYVLLFASFVYAHCYFGFLLGVVMGLL